MQNVIRHIIILAIIFGIAIPATAVDVFRDSVKVNFRTSKWNYEPALNNNGATLDSLLNVWQNVAADTADYRLKAVTVVGSASPEGSVEFNEMLSRNRADKIFEIVRKRINLPDSLAKFQFIGRDWQGLYNLVESDHSVPQRNATLSLLSEILTARAAGHKDNHSNLQRLRTLAGGKPYLYMFRKMFPSLRRSELKIEFDTVPHPVPVIVTPPPVDVDTVEVVEEIIEPVVEPEIVVPVIIEHKPFYMAIKTNMLYDAAAVPNLGVEF